MSINIFSAMRAMSAQMALQLLALQELKNIVGDSDSNDVYEVEKIIMNLTHAKERLDLLRGSDT